MGTPFSRTLRLLESDRSVGVVAATLVAILLFGACIAWMVTVPVRVYVTSEAARFEVDRTAHRLQAAVSGRVLVSHLVLGKEVQEGDVLLELDSQTQQFELNETIAHIEALERELVELDVVVATYERAEGEMKQTLPLAVREAAAKAAEASSEASFAASESKRTDLLREQGLASNADLLKTRAEAEQRRLSLLSAELSISSVRGARAVEYRRLVAQRQDLRRQAARLGGEAATLRASLPRLKREIERHRIRATVAGRLADVAKLTVGAMIEKGERCAMIVPPGSIRISAEFDPKAAVGRIRAGQAARLRLDAYPWAQYGLLPAVVARGASELEQGRVRIELDLLQSLTQIPIEHGMLGTVDIEVDRATPWNLLVRSTGRLLGKSAGDRS